MCHALNSLELPSILHALFGLQLAHDPLVVKDNEGALAPVHIRVPNQQTYHISFITAE